MSSWKPIGVAVLAATLLPPAVTAADQDAINRAIDRGVQYVKSQQNQDGTWPYLHDGKQNPRTLPSNPNEYNGGYTEIGATALAGLTLLECRLAPDDDIIRKTADALREPTVHLTHTYSLSLCIMFFDRLGDPADVPLIESMTVRLLAGQNAHGGWSYACPAISDTEKGRLADVIKQRSVLKTTEPQPKTPAKGKRTPQDLPKEISAQIESVNNHVPDRNEAGDNSNTQFATLALWVARRHGLPVDAALARVGKRFRETQNADHGWGYSAQNRTTTPTMTCAGLLGLAFDHGVRNDAILQKDPKATPGKGLPNLKQDQILSTGVTALGSLVGQPAERIPGLRSPWLRDGHARLYYFLWSLERLAMAFDFKKINNVDWYEWGANILVVRQENSGGWHGEFLGSQCAETCFALLFLRRANLAHDLTASLMGQQIILKAGVGVENLPGVTKKPDQKPDTKNPNTSSSEPKNKPSPVELDAADLSSQLVKGPADKQDQLLEQLREGKGAAYTDALAAAVPKLTGTAKNKARDALAERMARMSAPTLADKLQDEDLEVRRAAALGCAMKEDKSNMLRLIALLEDPEPPVSRAALASLKKLTGQDFGPSADASRSDRAEAVAAWKAWWAKQGK